MGYFYFVIGLMLCFMGLWHCIPPTLLLAMYDVLELAPADLQEYEKQSNAGWIAFLVGVLVAVIGLYFAANP